MLNFNIKRIVDELLSPSNIREYQNILNKEIPKEESELIDCYVKFWSWEIKHDKKEIEKPKEVGMRFEYPKVDISKYEWKPNKD